MEKSPKVLVLLTPVARREALGNTKPNGSVLQLVIYDQTNKIFISVRLRGLTHTDLQLPKTLFKEIIKCTLQSLVS